MSRAHSQLLTCTLDVHTGQQQQHFLGTTSMLSRMPQCPRPRPRHTCRTLQRHALTHACLDAHAHPGCLDTHAHPGCLDSHALTFDTQDASMPCPRSRTQDAMIPMPTCSMSTQDATTVATPMPMHPLDTPPRHAYLGCLMHTLSTREVPRPDLPSWAQWRHKQMH